jgi:hypothetical protein
MVLPLATPACEDDALALFPEVFRTRGGCI